MSDWGDKLCRWCGAENDEHGYEHQARYCKPKQTDALEAENAHLRGLLTTALAGPVSDLWKRNVRAALASVADSASEPMRFGDGPIADDMRRTLAEPDPASESKRPRAEAAAEMREVMGRIQKHMASFQKGAEWMRTQAVKALRGAADLYGEDEENAHLVLVSAAQAIEALPLSPISEMEEGP